MTPTSQEIDILTVGRWLFEIRERRDQCPIGSEVRSAYNELADRADVLLSKLYQQYLGIPFVADDE